MPVLHEEVTMMATAQNVPHPALILRSAIIVTVFSGYAPASFIWMKSPCQLWYQTWPL